MVYLFTKDFFYTGLAGILKNSTTDVFATGIRVFD